MDALPWYFLDIRIGGQCSSVAKYDRIVVDSLMLMMPFCTNDT